MSARRTRRWFECLSALKPETFVPTPFHPKNSSDIRHGRNVHELIQEQYPEMRRNAEFRYSDPTLPFDILYHPDLWDWKNQIVYEIKPVSWYLRNTQYCLAQLAGYIHFRQARAGQFLFYSGWTTHWPYNPPFLPSWEPELKSIALTSDAILNGEVPWEPVMSKS